MWGRQHRASPSLPASLVGGCTPWEPREPREGEEWTESRWGRLCGRDTRGAGMMCGHRGTPGQAASLQLHTGARKLAQNAWHPPLRSVLRGVRSTLIDHPAIPALHPGQDRLPQALPRTSGARMAPGLSAASAGLLVALMAGRSRFVRTCSVSAAKRCTEGSQPSASLAAADRRDRPPADHPLTTR